MSRLNLVILERDEPAMIQLLGEAGIVHLTSAEAEIENAAIANNFSAQELTHVNQLAARLEKLLHSLPAPKLSAETKTPSLNPEQAEQQLTTLEAQVAALFKRREECQSRQAALAASANQVSGFLGANLPLDRSEDAAFLHFVTGTLPDKNIPPLKLGDRAAFLPLSEKNGQRSVIAITTRENRAQLDQVLQQAGFVVGKLPIISGETTDTFARQNRDEQTHIAEQLKQINARLQAIADKFAPMLNQIGFALENRRLGLEASQKFSRTSSAVFISGWLPDSRIPDLESDIRKLAGGNCVINFIPADKLASAEVPVLLQPPRWLRPFGHLVAAYGLPRYQELEPTLFFAASFVLMFGMMFGDVGHGAVMALGGLAALQISRQKKFREAGFLLLTGGISSLIFGFVYGSCFGLPNFSRFALWCDPVAGDPMALMSFAIGLGITVISLGLVLNIVNRFRRGDRLGAWLGQFGIAGAVFYWGTLLLLAKLTEIQSMNLLTPAIALFLVLPVAGWALKGPLECWLKNRSAHPAQASEGWFAAVAESLAGSFEAMLSFLANTISFVRLAAYAMSHAALLVAVFLVAENVRHLPAVGTLLGAFVIILGNAVVILLEGIIATVQALRLEFYEFFSKFFSGSGEPFKPFRLQTKTVAETPL